MAVRKSVRVGWGPLDPSPPDARVAPELRGWLRYLRGVSSTAVRSSDWYPFRDPGERSIYQLETPRSSTGTQSVIRSAFQEEFLGARAVTRRAASRNLWASPTATTWVHFVWRENRGPPPAVGGHARVGARAVGVPGSRPDSRGTRPCQHLAGEYDGHIQLVWRGVPARIRALPRSRQRRPPALGRRPGSAAPTAVARCRCTSPGCTSHPGRGSTVPQRRQAHGRTEAPADR